MTLQFEPIWFDSMGAKSSCTLVKTPDISILIDPGAAVMQPSFPASDKEKEKWLNLAEKKIKKASENVDCIIISHYHYDHYFFDDFEIYKGKKVFIKNPNEYINSTQRIRAEEFFQNIYKYFNVKEKEKIISDTSLNTYPDPRDKLPHAINRDFKSYNPRRNELLEKGKKRFDKQILNWKSYKKLPEIKSKDIEIIFSENSSFNFGDTNIRFSEALFHGIEFATVGWVYATIIEYKGKKFFHSSDLSGPMIEDYADLIINENPSFLVLDGPTTYLFGYILNRINLERTIENTKRIIKEINSDVIIYDHHLTREATFRERTRNVWKTAEKLKKRLGTAAEYLGQKTVVESKK